MDNKEIIKEITSYMTGGIFFSYIIGYLVVTGFLSYYKIFNDDLLNLNFLKAGLVFLMIIIPILLIVHLFFYNIRKRNKKGFLSLSILVFLYLLFLFVIFTAFNKWNLDIFLSLLLFTIFTMLISLAILYFFNCKRLSFVNLKTYLILTSFLIFICLASYFFGSHYYKDLPASFKGGFPDSTVIICKEKATKYLKDIGFNFNDTTFIDTVEILYSSSDKLLIDRKSEVYFLSKDLFNGYKRINKK